jgi:hypothetical protein
MNLAAILDELGVAPNLPGARCVDRYALFDLTIEATRTGPPGAADVAAARAEALRLCAGCPELAPCGEWFDKQPKSFRPLGVIAGRVVTGRIQASRKTPRREIA